MEGEVLRQGKERVERILTGPLEMMGMGRKRGVKVEDHAAMLDRLRARLAYMGEDELAALREVVERYATGRDLNTWPDEISVINWARRIQPPPPSESRLVRSYLQSGAGRAAQAGDYLVELFRYLKVQGQPPNEFALSQIIREADERRRDLPRVERAVKDGRASPQEEHGLRVYMNTLARCEAILRARVDAEREDAA